MPDSVGWKCRVVWAVVVVQLREHTGCSFLGAWEADLDFWRRSLWIGTNPMVVDIYIYAGCVQCVEGVCKRCWVVSAGVVVHLEGGAGCSREGHRAKCAGGVGCSASGVAVARVMWAVADVV